MPQAGVTELALSEHTYLRLDVGFYGPPDAADAGRILERLAHAFSSEIRGSDIVQARLEIDRVFVSSLIADLRAIIDFADVASRLYETREAVLDFLRNLSIAIVTLKDSNGGEIAAPLRSFLQALVAPLASGRASHARLTVNGDNTVVIYIERPEGIELHTMIATILAEQSRRTVGSISSNSLADSGSPASVGGSRVKPMDVSRAVPPRPMAQDNRTIERPSEPTEREEHESAAMIMSVNGEWFARPEAAPLSLVPITDEGGMFLHRAHHLLHRAIGTLRRNGRGDPDRFVVRTVE